MASNLNRLIERVVTERGTVRGQLDVVNVNIRRVEDVLKVHIESLHRRIERLEQVRAADSDRLDRLEQQIAELREKR